MSQVNQDASSLIEQLHHKSSPKRRAAAKKLRKLKSREAGFSLLTALKKELLDKRTWETQYHMIMALGSSGYTESLSFLVQLADANFEATMVYVAIGDAVTTLEHGDDSFFPSLMKWIDRDNMDLVDGGLRSLATNQLSPNQNEILKILKYVSLPENQDIQFWAVAAAPGWPEHLTAAFLEQILASPCPEDTKKAALAALNGEYLAWNPL